MPFKFPQINIINRTHTLFISYIHYILMNAIIEPEFFLIQVQYHVLAYNCKALYCKTLTSERSTKYLCTAPKPNPLTPPLLPPPPPPHTFLKYFLHLTIVHSIFSLHSPAGTSCNSSADDHRPIRPICKDFMVCANLWSANLIWLKSMPCICSQSLPLSLVPEHQFHLFRALLLTKKLLKWL